MPQLPLNIIMITLLTALMLSCPLSSVSAEAARANATIPQNLPAALTASASSPPVPPTQDSNGSAPKEEEKIDAFPNMAAKVLCDFFGLPNSKPDTDRDEDDYCDLRTQESTVTHKWAKHFHVEHLTLVSGKLWW
jgi:hypothetical protein